MDTRRLASIALIVLLHVGFLYAFTSGLVHDVAKAVPQVVYAVMLPTEKPAAQPAPKELPLPKKSAPPVETLSPPTPVIDNTPAPLVQSGPVPMRESAPAPSSAPSVAAAPAAPATPAAPKLISAVEYVQAPRPDYPASSRRRSEEGVVHVRVLIDENGRAAKAEIAKSSEWPKLDEAARVAVMRALFKPYMENGKAVQVYAIVPINFQLG